MLTVGDDTYCALERADTFLGDRDARDWVSYDPASRERFLRRATDWVERTFRDKFRSVPATSTQRLHFPALDLNDHSGRRVEGIPRCVEEVTILVADLLCRERVTLEGIIDSSYPVKKEKAVVEVEYDTSRPRKSEDQLEFAYLMLRPVTNQGRLLRA